MVKHCVAGVNCGRTCVARGLRCKRSVGQETLPGPLCVDGNPCGDTCISAYNVCRAQPGTALRRDDASGTVLNAIANNIAIGTRPLPVPIQQPIQTPIQPQGSDIPPRPVITHQTIQNDFGVGMADYMVPPPTNGRIASPNRFRCLLAKQLVEGFDPIAQQNRPVDAKACTLALAMCHPQQPPWPGDTNRVDDTGGSVTLYRDVAQKCMNVA